jgi:peroxiredoxin
MQTLTQRMGFTGRAWLGVALGAGVLSGAFLLSACSKEPSSKDPAAVSSPAAAQPEISAAKAELPKKAAEPAAQGAAVGQAAPDFTLTDLDGKTVRLSDFKGKVVVLEWFNPECPFVRKSHTVGSLINTAEKHTKDGVVWLAINSGAAGKQGHGIEINKQGHSDFKLSHPILLDESGSVGKAYGAERTPHLYVIAKDGTLAYRGAIDNSRDGEGKSPEGGKLINYVDEALADLAAERPVKVKQTEAYGCGVKYGS